MDFWFVCLLIVIMRNSRGFTPSRWIGFIWIFKIFFLDWLNYFDFFVFVWISLVLFEFVWICLDFFGYVCVCLCLCSVCFVCLLCFVFLWVCLNLFRFVLIRLNLLCFGFLWVCLDSLHFFDFFVFVWNSFCVCFVCLLFA